MSMPSKKLFLAGLFGMLLAGCVSFDEVSKTISDSRASAEGAVAQQNQMRKSGAVVRMGSAKLAGNEVPVKAAQQLPQNFNRPFAYLSAHQPLSAILGEVGRRTGMATAIQPSDRATNNAGASAAVTPGMPNFSGGADAPIAVDWNGDLKGLLDYLATTARMYWKYEDGRIYFFKSETRSFHVFLPAGKRAVKSSISLTGTGSGNSGGSNGGGSGGNGGSNGGGGGTVGGTVDVASSMEIDAYDAIVKSVQAIVSSAEGVQPTSGGGAANGGSVAGSRNVVANPSLGLITVTGTPEILDRVASHVRSVNERFAQNVMIGVKVYNLTVNKGVNAGVSLQAAYRSLTDRLGVTLAGAPNMAPLNSAIPGTLVIDAVSGNWTGSQLLLQAMEQIGNVQYVTSGQVIAANGQPSPLQVATEFSYVSERTPATITLGSVIPGKVTSTIRSVGFTANFLPLILGDNRIMLQYQINLSSLLSLDTFGVGDNAIQIPKVATQSLQQQAFLKDGQSIVLLGFEQERAQLDKATGLTGISKNAGSDRNLMVIVMEVFSGK
ncbi:secretin N-terminal domain-containing protein [Janthinobacterium sp. 17J80-10]|uniref:type II secretion system protein GspD n=1 Tax=Janthinobacterium sp. 17J80-10 TaxID=2497863 RepID=UPI0013E8A5A2|nr:secretin N-terminal domain-containing protein [Janthinobacterium sp. 17J80-10]